MDYAVTASERCDRVNENKKKIGIMGGTFNPIHCGHLMIAEDACNYCQLDEVIFIPS